VTARRYRSSTGIRHSSHRLALAPSDWLLLGALQGVTELLPVSSSAHVRHLAAALAARRGGDLSRRALDQTGRAIDVAGHAGSLLGLVVCARLSRPRSFGTLVRTLLPAVAASVVLRRPLARAAGDARATAAAQLASGLALLAAASCRRTTPPPERKTLELAVGFAQTIALVPGVSRSGAVVTVALALGAEREEVERLLVETHGPVLAAAAARELVPLVARSGNSAPLPLAGLALCAASAAATTIALGRPGASAARVTPAALRAAALYRVALALAAGLRAVMWHDGREGAHARRATSKSATL
jgi:undecaprenyl pyrophosphate phosphatase UppP